jgi:hypothetical protein
VAGSAVKIAGRNIVPPHQPVSFVAVVEGTGSVTADVRIEGSHDGVLWIEVDKYELSGTDTDHDGASMTWAWPYVRGRVHARSGTEAAVTLTMAV